MPTNILMPALSPTMTEGTLAKWLKKEGDTIRSGDVIAEIETDKATMEVEAADEGKIGKIIVAAGTAGVKVNEVIAILLAEGETANDLAKAPQSPIKTPAAPTSLSPASTPVQKVVSPTATVGQSASTSRVFATPLARRIAAERGVHLFSVKGTGPGGRVVKADVLAAPAGGVRKSGPAGPAMDARALADALGMGYVAVPHSGVRKVIAARLQESKQTVPHFYLTVECQIDSLLSARKALNDQAGGTYKLSVNDFVIKAVAAALKTYPAANVAWTDEAMLQFSSSDISVAVATPNGLITPIVKAAETKSLPEISAEIKDLAARAREGKLKPTEFQGGTFSISNLGMYGVKEFGAIINPPQACILAVGAGIEQPVVVGGRVEIRTVMTCTLSVDHRAVDGAAGAEFLQIFKKYIEDPILMLV